MLSLPALLVSPKFAKVLVEKGAKTRRLSVRMLLVVQPAAARGEAAAPALEGQAHEGDAVVALRPHRLVVLAGLLRRPSDARLLDVHWVDVLVADLGGLVVGWGWSRGRATKKSFPVRRFGHLLVDYFVDGKKNNL